MSTVYVPVALNLLGWVGVSLSTGCGVLNELAVSTNHPLDTHISHKMLRALSGHSDLTPQHSSVSSLADFFYHVQDRNICFEFTIISGVIDSTSY